MQTPAAGLCTVCRHCRTVATTRGSVFYRCVRADTEPRFARYPRLPVVSCTGYEAAAEQPHDE